MLIDERYCLIPGPLLQVSRLHMQQLVLKIEVWLSEFTWLAYSNIYNGAFCKCALCLLLRLSVAAQTLPAH